MLAEVALHLEGRLRGMKGQHKIFRLDHAFSAFSGDIIGRICLDAEEEGRFLDDPNLGRDWYCSFLLVLMTPIKLFMDRSLQTDSQGCPGVGPTKGSKPGLFW